MKSLDKVRVVDKPISLLKIHAGKIGRVVRYEDGEYLVDLDGELWWSMPYDIEPEEDYEVQTYKFS